MAADGERRGGWHVEERLRALREGREVLRGERLVMRALTGQDAADLVELMRTDAVLRQAAGMTEAATRETPEGYLGVCAAWWEKKRTLVMAIVREGKAIGTISLARIDAEKKTGAMGYWIGSAHWRQGVATEAFALVLGLARELGLERVCDSKIRADNPGSWKLWERWGTVRFEGAYAVCEIELRRRGME